MPTSDESRLVVGCCSPGRRPGCGHGGVVAGEAVSGRRPSAPPPRGGQGAAWRPCGPRPVVDDDGRAPWPGALPVPSGTAADHRDVGHLRRAQARRAHPGSMGAWARAVNTVLGAEPGDAWRACVPLSSDRRPGHRGPGRGRRPGAGGDPALRPRRGRGGRSARSGTLVSLVPTMLRRLLRIDAALDGPVSATSSWAGVPCPPPPRRRPGLRCLRLHDLRQTETGGGCVHDGRPPPRVELRIDATTGEILVRERWSHPATCGTPTPPRPGSTPDGWWRTGDAGLLDEHDRLVRVERLTDVVITGGVNVSPTVVEAVLATHPAVSRRRGDRSARPRVGRAGVAHVVLPRPSDGLTLDALPGARSHPWPHPAELPRELRLVAAVAPHGGRQAATTAPLGSRGRSIRWPSGYGVGAAPAVELVAVPSGRTDRSLAMSQPGQ